MAHDYLDEMFPHRVCVNLDRRPERWRRMREKLARHGVRGVRRFAALDGEALDLPAHWTHTPGAYGCLKSHVEVVREAREMNAPSVLIFEDDVVFDDEFGKKFGQQVSQLPRDWDMLYLGALHKDEPAAAGANLVRLTRSNSTYAYALRETVYDAFIELNERAEDVLDNNCFELQRRFNCYCFMPHLAWVETDYSDAQRRIERHWYLQHSLVLFGARVDRLLAGTALVLAHDARRPHAAENLAHLAEYYDFFFAPHLAAVVVEEGARPTINAASLPPRFEHVFLPGGGGAFDRERCFRAGVERAASSRALFILSDSDLYLETLDIRGNLRMCERGDGATGFGEIAELGDAASRELRRTKTTRGLDLAESETHDAQTGCCLFVTRAALGETNERPTERLRALLTPGTRERARLFRSPNHALRLR